MITAFHDVFETKLLRIKKKLKELLDVPKQQRNRAKIKILLHEAKSLNKTLKKIQPEQKKTCPKCGHKF